jgi:SAM-dependent methyltransferase
MDGYEIETYGEGIADIYDEHAEGRTSNADLVAAVLAELAGALGGPARAVELAIGTGRIALPLVAAGIAVTGVDASPSMVEKLRAKPGGDAIPVVMGDFADVPVEGEWPLIFVVFNTFFALASQEEQVRCFANVAEHLAPGGVFVTETFVPDLSRFVAGRGFFGPVRVEVDRVDLDTSMHDPVNQVVTAQHIRLTPGDVRLDPVVIRYAWPSELDLMARLAGLRLRARWAGWDRAPFTAASTGHISIWERPA